MSAPFKEFQGTWEEVLKRSDELSGQEVRVTVVAPPEKPPHRYQSALDMLDNLKKNPWTPEELKFFDDFEQFRKEHPFSLRKPEDLD